ncbi:MAG: polysaccharide deacetylase family protein [Gammaproteobacteria bacterium]|nr:polysaccharide deacetylase family protein [Gammaproteobacteria bacterium]MBT8104807.1 polysaccharide deacetylase family protein [Gammaproteobacteria bacterium]NNK24821.1 polysaccharide deacetylase family protein [Woeseiaceae bacterium]
MKRLIALLLRATFVLHIVRFLNRKKVTILMLHGVAGDHADAGWAPLWPRMTPERLDLVLSQLGRHYRFVSIDDAVDMLAGRTPALHNALVLTFDDGYRNNLTEALPVLEKHGVPATFYIATGFVETGESYWIDRLDYALQKAPDEARLVDAAGEAHDLRGLDREGLAAAYRRMRLAVKNSVADDEQMLAAFDRISGQLEEAADASISDIIDTDPYVSVASWQELREAAARGGVEIGSHTVNHCRLTGIDAHSVAQQLTDSMQHLEQRVGEGCRHFCYPNGNYDADVAGQVRAAGYASAVTTENGLNAVGDDLMTLRRFAMPGKEDAFTNLMAISGLSQLPVIRRFASRLQ